jgi:hypothetical protein
LKSLRRILALSFQRLNSSEIKVERGYKSSERMKYRILPSNKHPKAKRTVFEMILTALN